MTVVELSIRVFDTTGRAKPDPFESKVTIPVGRKGYEPFVQRTLALAEVLVALAKDSDAE